MEGITEEKVIISVDLSNADYVRKADETVKKIEALRLEQLKLKAAGEQGNVQWEANKQAINSLNRELKSYTTLATAATESEKAMTDATENATLAYTNETGSINELRARLSILTAQRNAMSAADRDGSDAGRELTSETRSLSDQLKILEGNVGDTRRNVGNYKEGIKDAISATIPFGGELINAASSARAMAGGITNGSGALKVFKFALAATGIGLLILAVAALVNYLSKMKPLMDFIEQATDGLKAAFEVFGRMVFDVGKKLITALSSPLELIKDIGNFLAHPIDGMRKLGSAASAAGKEIKQAALEAANLRKQTQDQEDADREQVATLAKLRLERDKLALQAKNVSLTERQRIALLEAANQKEKEAFVVEQRNAINRLALLKEEERQFLKNNKAKEASDELQEKIFNSQAAVYDLEAQSLKFTEKRYNDQAKLREKAIAEEEKAAARRAKLAEEQKEADQAKVDSDNALASLSKTERQKEAAEIEADIAAKKEKFQKFGATTIALEKERIARLKALNNKYREEDAEELKGNLQKIEDIHVAAIRDKDTRELAQIAVQNERKLAEQDKVIEKTKQRILKGEEGLTELLLSQQNLRDEIIAENQFSLDAKNQEITDRKREQQIAYEVEEIERKKATLEAKKKIQEEERKLEDEGLALLQSVFGKETELGKAAFLAQKSFAIARIITDAQAAIASNVAAQQARAVWLSVIPFGQIAIAADAVASQAARTKIIVGSALAAATVVATTVQGFKDGVIDFNSDGAGSMVTGRGSGTSDSINARLSNGESVINARSTRMFAPLLSAINQIGGGRSLNGNYSGNRFADGGIFVSGSSPSDIMGREAFTQSALMEAVKGMVVQVDVRDIIRAQSTVTKAQVNQNI